MPWSVTSRSTMSTRSSRVRNVLARAKAYKKKDDRVDIIDKKVDDYEMLAITSIYIGYLLPMMVEIQWWDFKDRPAPAETSA